MAVPIAPDKVAAVRELLSQGMPAHQVAKRVGVSQPTACRIANGKHCPRCKAKVAKVKAPKPKPPPVVGCAPSRVKLIEFRHVKFYGCNGCGKQVEWSPCVFCAARQHPKGTIQPHTP